MQTVPRDAGTPQAGTGPPFTGLSGRQPVRIVAEDGNLVAYGFGRQRIAVPAGSISRLVLGRGFSLTVLDHDERMLLKAAGNWDPHGLSAVCASLGLPAPARVSRNGSRYGSRNGTRYGGGGYGTQQGRLRWRWSRGYHRLRVRPRGFALAMLVVGTAGITLTGFAGFAGALPAVALPGSVGSVRNLIGIAGALAGATAGLWLCITGVRSALATARWAAASLAMRSPAPWSPFYPRGNRGGAAKLLTAAMVLAVPALTGWGPGVGIVTLVHGFSDQALVSLLRTGGKPVSGYVIAVPRYSAGSSGDTTVTYQANLQFAVGQQAVITPDPAIGGRTWPAGPDPVTVVYDPAEPTKAAVDGQLRGSPWGGAPLGNLISSLVLTLALPVLTWRLILRANKIRRASRDGLLDGIW